MPRVNPSFARRLEGVVPLERVRPDTSLQTEISPKTVKDINLVVSRARKLSDGGEVAASTVGTICTADCISTASCVCVADFNDFAIAEPEIARAVATLHEHAVEKLGVDGLAKAMVEVNRSE